MASPRIAAQERSYSEALRQLNGLQKGQSMVTNNERSKLTGRERTLAWLLCLKLEIDQVKYIHVAGTKGKGTTCLYVENIIDTYHRKNPNRKKVGCLTSPHLITVRERIRIDSSPISKACFAKNFWELWYLMKAQQHASRPGIALQLPAYPGFITLLAFYTFIKESVDVAVIETGLGGQTDSTNVIEAPLATGITELGLDHVNVLGDTLEKIARHKAGIFKPGAPAFSVPQESAPARVLEDVAREKGLRVKFVDDQLLRRYNIVVKPDAQYQRMNASLALTLSQAYVKQLDPPGVLDLSVAQCIENTELPAKFEKIEDGQTIWILSSAHNEMSIDAACESFVSCLRDKDDYRRVLLFSHESHRDSTRFLDIIFKRVCQVAQYSFAAAVFCSESLNEQGQHEQEFIDLRKNAQKSSEIRQQHQQHWQSLHSEGDTEVVGYVDDVYKLIHKDDAKTIVFVTGSVYLAGMVRSILRKGDTAQ